MTVEKEWTVKLHDTWSIVESLSIPFKLAYVESERGYVYHPDGKVMEIFDDHERYTVCTFAWHPDGVTLYHCHIQLDAINTETGETTRFPNFPDYQHYCATWAMGCSPDGSYLLLQQFPKSPDAVRRICKIGTDGTDFCVLAELIEGGQISYMLLNWHSNTLWINTSKNESSETWLMNLATKELSRCVSLPSRLSVAHQLSCDGKNIVYTESTFSRQPPKGIFVFSLEQQETKVVSHFGRCPTWSPDRQKIAFIDEQCGLWVFDVATQICQNLLSLEGKNVAELSPRFQYFGVSDWSSDSRFLCFLLTTHHVGIVDFVLQTVWIEEGTWRADMLWAPA